MENNSQIIGRCLLSEQVSVTAVPTVLHLHENNLFIALDNGETQWFNIDGTSRDPFSASQTAVWALATKTDTLASGGVDGDIEIWSLITGQHLKTLAGHSSTIRALEFLNDSERIISASRDTTIRVWDIARGECTDILTAHAGTIRTLALSRAGDLLLSGSHDGTACLWRITSDKVELVHTVHGHEGVIYCVDFVDPAGTQFVTGGADTCIRVWDTVDGKCIATLRGHEAVVNQIISANSKLITCDASGWVFIWSTGPEHQVLHRLQTHGQSVTTLDCDGTTILSGGMDGTVALQDLQSGQLKGRLGHGDGTLIWKAKFVGDGKVALVVNRNDAPMLEVWDVD